MIGPKCEMCGSDDLWEGTEEVWRVTGQEGFKSQQILIIACECGHQQNLDSVR